MKRTSQMSDRQVSLSRRCFLAAGAASVAGAAAVNGHAAQTQPAEAEAVVRPPEGKRILLSCKLGMIPGKAGDEPLTLAERLSMAAEAGFDGVDLDQAAGFTPEQARDAVRVSGVFVHNAINHAHWKQRLTSAKEEERAQGRANI